MRQLADFSAKWGHGKALEDSRSGRVVPCDAPGQWRRGHVFQGRYKSVRIREQAALGAAFDPIACAGQALEKNAVPEMRVVIVRSLGLSSI
jgi:hypothetical protein